MLESADVEQKTTREKRFQRYSKADLTRIKVVRASTTADFDIVGKLRQAGFARIATEDKRNISWVDETDTSPGVFSLIGYDFSQQPVATMRVQDGRIAPLELHKFVPLDSLLQPADLPAAQFARLSVIKTAQATEVMFGLFWAAWRWCLCQGIQTMVIGTPPWSRPIYDFLVFEPLGPQGEFCHAFAGGAQHVVMKLSVIKAETILRFNNHPLCSVFFEDEHPNLMI